MSAEQRFDVEIIGRALRATAGTPAARHAEQLADEQALHGIPMQELLDWLYEWRGDPERQLRECLVWLATVRTTRYRETLKRLPCAFCGKPGELACDFRVGFGLDGNGKADTSVVFTCDLVMCRQCKCADEFCRFHAGKPHSSRVWSRGGAMSILRQLQWSAQQVKLSGGSAPVKHEPAPPAQTALFEAGAR